MGEKNEGRDSRALTGVGMTSPVPPKPEFFPQKWSCFSSGAGSRREEAAPGPPLSAVLIRGDAAPRVCRSAKISNLWLLKFLFLGTELVYPYCEHFLHQTGVIFKNKRIKRGPPDTSHWKGAELQSSPSRMWSSSLKSASYLIFSFQESHNPGFALY